MGTERGERGALKEDSALVCGVLLAAALLTGCATEEDVLFGDPARLAGFDSSTSSGPVECQVDPACTVSWKNDIFDPILASRSDGACGSSGCHDEGVGGLFFPDDDSEAAYALLKNYQLVGVGPYIVDCVPEQSAFMCNAQLPSAVQNPFVGDDLQLSGPCGSLMPQLKGGSPARALTLAELNSIALWIACGAPNN